MKMGKSKTLYLQYSHTRALKIQKKSCEPLRATRLLLFGDHCSRSKGYNVFPQAQNLLHQQH